VAIRDWTPGRIRWLWTFGLIAELLVIYVFVAPRYSLAPRAPGYDSVFSVPGPPSDPQRQEWHRILRDSLGINVAVSGDTLTTFSRDSFALAILNRGDTFRTLSLSLAARRAASTVTRPIAEALRAAAPFMIALLILYCSVTLLPIPLALLVLTLVWRRRSSPAQ
jgi:hypothetical protein